MTRDHQLFVRFHAECSPVCRSYGQQNDVGAVREFTVVGGPEGAGKAIRLLSSVRQDEIVLGDRTSLEQRARDGPTEPAGTSDDTDLW